MCGGLLHGGQIVDQVIALEDKRHMAAPVPGKAGFGNVLALVQNLTAARAVQAAQQGEQRITNDIFTAVYGLGLLIALFAVCAASIPVMRMKPNEILSKMG